MPDNVSKVRELTDLTPRYVQKDIKKAKELSQQILTLSIKLKDHQGLADGLSYLSYFDNYEGKSNDAIAKMIESVDHYRAIRDTAGLGKVYGNLAVAYEGVNKIDSGVYYREKAIAILEKAPTRLLGTQYLNLAAQFNNRFDNPKKALHYFKKAAGISESFKDSAKWAMALSGIGLTLIDLQRNDEALQYSTRAVSIAKKCNDLIAISYALEGYGRVLLEKNRVEESIQACREAVKMGLQAGYPDGYIIGAITLGKGLELKGAYGEESEVLEKALVQAKKLGNVQFYHDIYSGLASANSHLNNYKQAYDFRMQAVAFGDSMRTERDNRILADLDARYQTAQKETIIKQQELNVINKELQLQKTNRMLASSIGGTIMAILSALLIYVHFRNKKKLHQEQLQTIQKEKELQLLQAVMQGEEKERSRIAKDLHDGVAGMLAAVKMHINSIATDMSEVKHTEGFQQGMKLLDESSQEVRKTSHNLMPEVLLQHGLDEALRRYCNNVSNSSRLKLQYDVIGDTPRFIDSFELSVYRIVQELLNNIVKHSKASEAIVQLSYQPGILTIAIEDNGIGISKEDGSKDGMGLKSLQSRVKAMNGKIEFESSIGEGFNAYLEFETMELERVPMETSV
jgi:signal transduction histidine kinase